MKRPEQHDMQSSFQSVTTNGNTHSIQRVLTTV